MKVDFEDKDLETLILTGVGRGKHKKYARDKVFMKNLDAIYGYMCSAGNISVLSAYSFLHYERLRHHEGMSSIRVMNGRKERLLFHEHDDKITITIIELNTNHYGSSK